MKVLFGELNNKAVIKSYTGINTETANTTVDNKNNTIKVDVNTDNIATIDYVNEHIDTFTGEITLSGDEELVLQIQNGRLYHEGELYTGDITFSDDYIVGDANGDRVVSQEDADDITSYSSKGEPEVDIIASDVNLDGSVNAKDSLQISRYLNGQSHVQGIGETFTRPIITLNVQEGITYFEGSLYTDTITLSGDATLYIVYEKGLVKNITSTNPNLDGNVRYDSEQELTDSQKSVVRKNIGVDSEINKFGIALIYNGDQIDIGADIIYTVGFIGDTIPHTNLLYLGGDDIDPFTMYPSIPPRTDLGVTLKGNQIAFSLDGIIYNAKDENDSTVYFTIEPFEYEGNTYFLLIESV